MSTTPHSSNYSNHVHGVSVRACSSGMHRLLLGALLWNDRAHAARCALSGHRPWYPAVLWHRGKRRCIDSSKSIVAHPKQRKDSAVYLFTTTALVHADHKVVDTGQGLDIAFGPAKIEPCTS